jgi:hypothetical protein
VHPSNLDSQGFRFSPAPQKKPRKSKYDSQAGGKYFKRKHSEIEMIAELKRMEAGREAEDVARAVGITFDPFLTFLVVAPSRFLKGRNVWLFRARLFSL